MSTYICRLGEEHNWCPLECRLSVGNLSPKTTKMLSTRNSSMLIVTFSVLCFSNLNVPWQNRVFRELKPKMCICDFHWVPETLTPLGHLVWPLVCRGPWMSTVVLYCWCRSDSASVLLYFTFLSHLFPLPCGADSTVPREGLDSSVIMPFSWCVVAVTLPI